MSELTREEMLEVISRLEDEARDEFRVIKKGEWPKERLEIIEKRLVGLEIIRCLIENQPEVSLDKVRDVKVSDVLNGGGPSPQKARTWVPVDQLTITADKEAEDE